jgi:hypothetical protein
MHFGGFIFEAGRSNHSDDPRAGLQHYPARHVQSDPSDFAKPRFGARKHHTPNTRPVDRPGAHRARLSAGVERAVSEKSRVVVLCRQLNQVHLGVVCHIVAGEDAVFGALDNFALLYQYRAKRLVAVCHGGFRERNRLAQKRLVIFHKDPQELERDDSIWINPAPPAEVLKSRTKDRLGCGWQVGLTLPAEARRS